MNRAMLEFDEAFYDGGYYGESVRQMKLGILRSQPEVQTKIDRSRRFTPGEPEEYIQRQYERSVRKLSLHNQVHHIEAVTLEQIAGVVEASTRQAIQELGSLGIVGKLEPPAPLLYLPDEVWSGVNDYYDRS